MIPAYISEDSAPGEKALFRALASSAGTEGWIVLHSLGIARHVRNPEGEADFVVIVPGTGILVIEVKSHRSASFNDGRWKLGNDAPTTRGPIKQAGEAMHSLRRYLAAKSVDLRSIPILAVAWFTAIARARSEFATSPEWHEWQVLDKEDLDDGAVGAIRRTLSAGTRHLDETFAGFSYGGVGPDGPASQRIAAVLRPRFEVGITAGDLRRAREDQLTRFIDEQYVALDAMADNHAVLFTGPAGSGKTLLAVEAARREVEMGGRGRLICFNNFLGKRVTAAVSHPGLTVGTLHRQLLDLTGMSIPADAPDHFWRQELPERALEVLLDGGSEAADFLIVDEVQDMACDSYLDVLDLMVRGGLRSGRVLLFGDFERQAIFAGPDGRDLLRARVSHLVISRLTTNCRNRPRIGEVVNTFSRLDPGFQRFRRDDDGANPQWRSYSVGDDQTPKLLAAIHDLREEGYDLHEIVVLSPLRVESLAATTDDRWLRQILHPADGRPVRRGDLQYSTIQAFKGLEAPAVVLTELDRNRVPKNFGALLYVGLTRATDRLWGVIEKATLRAGMEGSL